jgi:flavin-dependent dehydrogenase
MRMSLGCDALVIGAGPAGSAVAILLAAAGWRVSLVEQHAFPRRKVCGECIAAGNLELLDRLGVGPEFRAIAGPELRQVGWMHEATMIVADMPACLEGPYAFGRALGRDRLDSLLLRRALELGVSVLQPAQARAVAGKVGAYSVEVAARGVPARRLEARILIDAHGSWERGPPVAGERQAVRPPNRTGDLFAFKATYLRAAIAPGFLPVLALRGAYGGMVLGEAGRTTLACCIRRDTLAACRAAQPQASAGEAVAAYLERECSGVRQLLDGAERQGAWLSVGPLRPGVRLPARVAASAGSGVFRVGNAAGESHPLIGEGISMALQSAALLAATLTARPAAAFDVAQAVAAQRRYTAAWRAAFLPRLRLAATYAQLAMRPPLARAAGAVLGSWPGLLVTASRLAGKTRRAPISLVKQPEPA